MSAMSATGLPLMMWSRCGEMSWNGEIRHLSCCYLIATGGRHLGCDDGRVTNVCQSVPSFSRSLPIPCLTLSVSRAGDGLQSCCDPPLSSSKCVVETDDGTDLVRTESARFARSRWVPQVVPRQMNLGGFDVGFVVRHWPTTSGCSPW